MRHSKEFIGSEAHKGQKTASTGTSKFTEVFHANMLIASWPTITPRDSAILVKSIDVGWNQIIIQRLYEIGTRNVWIFQKTTGVLEAGQLIAPRQTTAQFYQRFTPTCDDSTSLICQVIDDGKHPPWAMTGFQICSIGSTMIDGNLARLDQFGGTFHDLENPVAAP
jgi:hypothetical protein